MLAGALRVYSVSTLGHDVATERWSSSSGGGGGSGSKQKQQQQDDTDGRFSPSLSSPSSSCFITLNMGFAVFFRWYKADTEASGLIGSKEGYVLNIIGIFKQYWGYFERLS